MRTTHGLSRTPEYSAWNAMRHRCRSPKAAAYLNYGARGIDYAPEWESVEQFVADMGVKPTPRHTLERVDNSLGYSKDNCIWALPLQQTRNRRITRTLTAFGETKTVKEWCDASGLKYTTLLMRVDSYCMAVEDALSTPTRHMQFLANQARKALVSYGGALVPLKDLALMHGVPPGLARSRKAAGWSVEEILSNKRNKATQ